MYPVTKEYKYNPTFDCGARGPKIIIKRDRTLPTAKQVYLDQISKSNSQKKKVSLGRKKEKAIKLIIINCLELSSIFKVIANFTNDETDRVETIILRRVGIFSPK